MTLYLTSRLNVAAASGRIDLVTKFLAEKDEVNQREFNGVTPLHSAAFGGHVDIITLLLSKGANILAKDFEGATPLFYAAQEGHFDAMTLLMHKMARPDINAKNIVGNTAMHVATLNRRLDIVTIFIALEFNSFINCRNNEGASALDLLKVSDIHRIKDLRILSDEQVKKLLTIKKDKKMEESLEVERSLQQVELESCKNNSNAGSTSSKTKKKKKKKGKENQAQGVKIDEAVNANTNVETQDAAAASGEHSDIQGGARPKTTTNKILKVQNKNSMDNNVSENSNQELSNTYVKDIMSLISNKTNSELSVEELEVLEALAVVKLKNASSELKDLDDVVHDLARSKAAKLTQFHDQTFSIAEKKQKTEKEKAALQEKIKLLDCEIKELDQNLKELDQNLDQLKSQIRKQEKETDGTIDEKIKEKTEYLAKISSLEENLKQIRNDKMEKSKNKEKSYLTSLPEAEKKAPNEIESGDGSVCPICLSSYKEIKQTGVRLVSTHCGHIFCHKCLDVVMDVKNGKTDCPICKKRITRNSYHTIFL